MTDGALAIPIVDVAALFGSDTDRRVLADRVREICHDIGFMVIINHGVPADFVASVFEVMQRIFALPTEQKLLIDKRNSRHFRGWEPVGTEFTNNRPDIREQIDVWTDRPALPADVVPPYRRLIGPNQWIPDEVCAGHRDITIEWFERMGSLADRLLGLLSLGLGLDEHHLANWFGNESMSLTKFINYPRTPEGSAGVNAHHDTGFLTLLAAGTTPGLQVMHPEQGWIDVPVVADSFVVNLGEMLQAMTGNYFVATAHRVITTQARLSCGYFHGPSLDAPLDPLPLAERFRESVANSQRHLSAGFMASREETDAGVGDMASTARASTYGEQLWNYFARSYPDNMARHYGAP